MMQRVIGGAAVMAAITLAFFVNITSPITAGPLGVLFVFVLIYVAALGVFTFFIYGASRVLSVLARVFVGRRPLQRLTFRQAYYYGSVVSVAPIILIGVQSVSRIGIYETLLVSALVGLGCFYVSKRAI